MKMVLIIYIGNPSWQGRFCSFIVACEEGVFGVKILYDVFKLSFLA